MTRTTRTTRSGLFALALALTAAAMALAGCGDTSTGPSPPPPAPAPTTTGTGTTQPAPPPTRSNAELELTGSFVCLDPFCDFARFSLALTNHGGVGANINFVRVENRNAQPVLELGADHFVNAFGHNRVERGQTFEFVLNGQLGFVVIIGYRDDNGVKGDARWFPDLPR